jgi:hypothetical protein
VRIGLSELGVKTATRRITHSLGIGRGDNIL